MNHHLRVETGSIDSVKAKFFIATIDNVKLHFCKSLADHANRVEAKFDVLGSKLDGLALGSGAWAEAGDTIDSLTIDVWVDSRWQHPSDSLGAAADDTIDNVKVKVNPSLCVEGDNIDHVQMAASFTHVQVSGKAADVPAACYINITTAAPGCCGAVPPNS